jgi:hypothetical protein
MGKTVLELDEETEELLDHAEENLVAVILGTAAFCKERRIPFGDWVAFLGNRVAATWEEVQGQGPRQVARLVALNVVAAGGDVHELSGENGRAELRCSWPDAEDLAHFGLTREDLDPFLNVYSPIAARLGLRYEARRAGEQITVVFSR